jgi:hypothetical protein
VCIVYRALAEHFSSYLFSVDGLRVQDYRDFYCIQHEHGTIAIFISFASSYVYIFISHLPNGLLDAMEVTISTLCFFAV